MSHWSRESILELIELLEKSPNLWNPSHPGETQSMQNRVKLHN